MRSRKKKKSKNHNMRDGRDGKMKSTTSNHLRTMVIHDNITADLFEDIEDDSTYTDPSIPCSGSTNDNVQGHYHQGHGHRNKQDNRTMIVHESEPHDHRSRRQTTESELTATAAAGG